MSQLDKVWWPEVFTNPDFVYAETKDTKKQATADAYMGWANCLVGNKGEMPEGFGKGMVKIRQVIGHEEMTKTMPSRTHACDT